MSNAADLIIEAPKRRRKTDRYTEADLGTFAEAWHLPQLAENSNFAIKVGEAETENDARTIARDAQRELKARHSIDARTSVFKAGNVYVAALRKKSGESGGPGVAAGNVAPEQPTTAVAGWSPDMVGAANPDQA